MGEYEPECAATTLPVGGRRTKLIFVRETAGRFTPLSLPVDMLDLWIGVTGRGTVVDDWNARRIAGHFRELAPDGVHFAELGGANSPDAFLRMDPVEAKETWQFAQELSEFVDVILSGQLYNCFAQVDGQKSGLVLVLAEFFSSIARLSECDPSSQLTRSALLPLSTADLLRRCFGEGRAAAALYHEVDGPDLRERCVELIQFRAWFDERRSWQPLYIGEILSPQFSLDETECRINDVEAQFAPWPQFRESFRAYRRDPYGELGDRGPFLLLARFAAAAEATSVANTFQSLVARHLSFVNSGRFAEWSAQHVGACVPSPPLAEFAERHGLAWEDEGFTGEHPGPRVLPSRSLRSVTAWRGRTRGSLESTPARRAPRPSTPSTPARG